MKLLPVAFSLGLFFVVIGLVYLGQRLNREDLVNFASSLLSYGFAVLFVYWIHRGVLSLFADPGRWLNIGALGFVFILFIGLNVLLMMGMAPVQTKPQTRPGPLFFVIYPTKMILDELIIDPVVRGSLGQQPDDLPVTTLSEYRSPLEFYKWGEARWHGPDEVFFIIFFVNRSAATDREIVGRVFKSNLQTAKVEDVATYSGLDYEKILSTKAGDSNGIDEIWDRVSAEKNLKFDKLLNPTETVSIHLSGAEVKSAKENAKKYLKEISVDVGGDIDVQYVLPWGPGRRLIGVGDKEADVRGKQEFTIWWSQLRGPQGEESLDDIAFNLRSLVRQLKSTPQFAVNGKKAILTNSEKMSVGTRGFQVWLFSDQELPKILFEL